MAPRTPEEKAKLKAAAEEADKSIHFISVQDLRNELKSTPTMMLFFGAKWCPNTQKFNPEYLKVQKMVDGNPKLKESGFIMRKVECGPKDVEKFCLNDYPVDGYIDGKFKEEYPGDNQAEELYKYIQSQVKLSAIESKPAKPKSHDIKPLPEIVGGKDATQLIGNLPAKPEHLQIGQSNNANFLNFTIGAAILFGVFALIMVVRRNRRLKYQRVEGRALD